MTAPLKLGRIWTVPIQGTYSLLLLVALVASLAAWQFRSMVGGYNTGAYAVAGLFSAVLFLWTVFAHETAHVAAARHFGARVKGVTLSALGGETAISGEPGSPWQGIAVATSGPAVSALCGIACIGGGLALAHVGTPLLLAACFVWVGILCVLLAVVNLIPAAPLDGGHVLQSLLWAATGNRSRASAISGLAGQVVGVATVLAAGWFAVRGASAFVVLGTAVVGWPLWRGASAVRRSARQRIQLAGVLVGDLVSAGQTALPAGATAAAAAERLGERGTGWVAIVDGTGQPIALVSVARVRRAAAEHAAQPVGDLRRRRARVPTATPDEPLADALERTHAQPKPVAVTQDGRLVGVLDPDDVRAAIRDAPRVPRPARTGSDDWPGSRRGA